MTTHPRFRNFLLHLSPKLVPIGLTFMLSCCVGCKISSSPIESQISVTNSDDRVLVEIRIRNPNDKVVCIGAPFAEPFGKLIYTRSDGTRLFPDPLISPLFQALNEDDLVEIGPKSEIKTKRIIRINRPIGEGLFWSMVDGFDRYELDSKQIFVRYEYTTLGGKVPQRRGNSSWEEGFHSNRLLLWQRK